MHKITVILIAIGMIGLPNFVFMFLGIFVYGPNVDPWFNSLVHPDAMPPNWVLPFVWVILYFAMGFASFLVWSGAFNADALESPMSHRRKSLVGLGAYSLQLLLNWLWLPVFFAWHEMLASLVVMAVLDVVVVVTLVIFVQVRWLAALVFTPYLVWLGFATYLNGEHWYHNRM